MCTVSGTSTTSNTVKFVCVCQRLSQSKASVPSHALVPAEPGCCSRRVLCVLVLTLGRSVAPSQTGEPSSGPTVLYKKRCLSAPSLLRFCWPRTSGVSRTRRRRKHDRLHPRSSSCALDVVPVIACPCCSVDAPKPPLVLVAVARRLRSARRRIPFAPVATGPRSSSSSGSGSSSSNSSSSSGSRSGRGSRARRSR